MRTRLLLMIALSAILALAACAENDDTDDSAPADATSDTTEETESNAEEVAEESTSEPEEEPTPDSEPESDSETTPTTEPETDDTDVSEELNGDSNETEDDELSEEPGEAEPELPVTFVDAFEEEIVIEDVSRIIPLSGDIAEVVYTLGFEENIVGVDDSASYPEYLREELPSIGYQFDLSAEGILSLDPTVVIGHDGAGPPEVLEQIRDAGVTVVQIEDISTMEAPGQKIRGVATALGVPERGEALAAETEDAIQEAMDLAAQAETEPLVAFLYLRGTDTQSIGGSGTVTDEMIEAAGGLDAGTAASVEGFQPVTPEALIDASPDVILVMSSGLQSVGGVEGMLEIPGVAQTPAGENQHIIDFEGLYLTGMGARTGEALMDLVLALHPDLEP